MGLPIPRLPPSAGPLDQLAAERATGALRGPSGCFYLVDGAVTCVESATAPGLDARLAAAGKVPPERWQDARDTAGAQHTGARYLVDAGLLTQGELEICHLGALLDAAFFALPLLVADDVFFTPGAGHWLGVVRRVGAATLQRATARRRALLGRLAPWAAVDTSPVVPLHPARPATMRPTSSQRRLLAHADGRRTPHELALALGRSAFVTLLDIRRLAAAGLVLVPDDAPKALPRRRPGACLDENPAPAEAARTPTWQPPVPQLPETADPDIALLVRLRTALEENL
ncbi:hypothetical protein [Streptomyces sp. NPDC017993]|uniref:hypothetical protein n=1 Tax=Streptomyces sp. NPDC017993 TaxID=3365027 RepID=UPI0037A35EB3